MTDDQWDERVAPIYAGRQKIAAALNDVLIQAREDGCTPLQISLAIVDLVKQDDGQVFIGLTRDSARCSAQIVAHYLGNVRPTQVEAWGQSGEDGFPPPSEGSSPKDWMLTIGDVYEWFHLRSRAGINQHIGCATGGVER